MLNTNEKFSPNRPIEYIIPIQVIINIQVYIFYKCLTLR